MTMTLTSADQTLRDGVTRHLAWDPEVDASLIGVSAQEGVVTLSGYVDTYAAKVKADLEAAKAAAAAAEGKGPGTVTRLPGAKAS